MSERERKPFEIQVGDLTYVLALGNCACRMFRNPDYQHMDYLWIDEQDDNPSMKIHDEVNLVRWMAGQAIMFDEEDDLVKLIPTFEGETFRSIYGWNAETSEAEEPTEKEKETYFRVTTQDDDGWKS